MVSVRSLSWQPVDKVIWISSSRSVGGPRAGESGGGAALRRLLHRGHCLLANLSLRGSRLPPAVSTGLGVTRSAGCRRHAPGTGAETPPPPAASAWPRQSARCRGSGGLHGCRSSLRSRDRHPPCPPVAASRCLPTYQIRKPIQADIPAAGPSLAPAAVKARAKPISGDHRCRSRSKSQNERFEPYSRASAGVAPRFGPGGLR